MDILVLGKRSRTVAAARKDGNGMPERRGIGAQRRARRVRGASGERRCGYRPTGAASARRGEDAAAALLSW